MRGANGLSIARHWWEVSAKDQPVGRLASRIVCALIGKHKPTAAIGRDDGDYVVVTNIRDIVFAGKKELYREYRSHSGRKGSGMIREHIRDVRRVKPDTILRHAVSGMLPKNSHRWDRLQRLRTFIGDDHPYKRNLIQRYDHGAPLVPPTNAYAPQQTLILPEAQQIAWGVEATTEKSSTGAPATAKPYGRPYWYNSRYSKRKSTNHVKRPSVRTK